jgi:hypothetical protein
VRLAPILYGVAAALTLSGLCLRIARPALPAPDPAQLRLAPAPRPSTATGDVEAANYQPIVAQNIFSEMRGTEPAKPAAVARRPERPRDPVQALALRGTTIGPRGAVALIGAEVYRIGDIVAGAKLVAITDSTVTLERPSGATVLHVPSSSSQPKL